MRVFTITANDSGQRLDKFISKSVPALPKALMYKYIRKKRIKRNGARAEIGDKLEIGDTIELYISDEFFAPNEASKKNYDFLSAPRSLSILYEDENILVLDKKAGVLCHPDKEEYLDTLITRVKRYLYEKGEYDPESENSFAPALANRIDRNTGGLVLAAKNAAALRSLNEQIKNRQIQKKYKCLVIGRMPRQTETLIAYLRKDSGKNTVYISETPEKDAKKIVTRYTVLGYRNGLSLLEIDLLTGRTHQIRAHLAFLGHPLLGDGKYGRNAENKRFGGYKKQCLYSYCIQFSCPDKNDILAYLDQKTFSTNDIWFEKAFLDGSI